LIYGDFSAGKVGIGTTSPAAKLDVSGDISASVYKIGGSTVLSVPGTSNTFVGLGAGNSNTESAANIFLGCGAGYFNTTGSGNTFSGNWAGYFNTTGSFNTFSGIHAGFENTKGYKNTCLGAEAGYSNTEGSGNVFIGYNAGYGKNGLNKLYIANSDVNNLIYGDFSNGRVGINTVNPAYELDVIGDIRATGSVYYGGTEGHDNGNAYWKPDYVFQDDYDVMSVEQVEEYLRQENHLPWLTSAKQEKKENGNVIDMTRMAFETVETAENLQIQIIKLNELIKEQAELMKEQQKRITALETRIQLQATPKEVQR
jgi:hypothetical protein